MNRPKADKQKMILTLLTEGTSIRSIERITGVHRDTIVRLICRIGAKCAADMDSRLNGLTGKYWETDEVWTYVHCKKERLAKGVSDVEWGDQYVFIAIDADSKLVPCFEVGKRSPLTATLLMETLKRRVNGHRLHLVTDGYGGYIPAIDSTFGLQNVDYAMLIKKFAPRTGDSEGETYSPRAIVAQRPSVISGSPDPARVSTSYIERQNLTLRMSLRRFARLTNAFSKRLVYLRAALQIHFWWYNFGRAHRSLSMATPAMAAGVTDTFGTWDDIIGG